MNNRGPKRKYKVITVPVPNVTWNQFNVILAVGVVLLGLVGYVIGDIRQPPAPVPTPELIVITQIATQPPAPVSTATPLPTAMPTAMPPQPVLEAAPTNAPISLGIQVVVDTQVPDVPAELPAAAAVDTTLSTIQMVMQSPDSMPSMDEAQCLQQVAAGMTPKWENGTCYISGEADPTWVAVNQVSPLVSCRSRSGAVAGLATYFGDGICFVTYNGVVSRWSWSGSAWQPVG